MKVSVLIEHTLLIYNCLNNFTSDHTENTFNLIQLMLKIVKSILLIGIFNTFQVGLDFFLFN